MPRIATPTSPRLRPGCAVVAVRVGEAGLVLVGLEALAPRRELLARDRLQDLALAQHQVGEALERRAGAAAQVLDALVVTDVAVRRRLPRAHEGLVARRHRRDVAVELAQVRMRLGEALVVARL